MKSIKIYVSLLVFSIGLISCEVRTTNVGNGNAKVKKIPPGQAKKIYGTKSAKPFAPGQNR